MSPNLGCVMVSAKVWKTVRKWKLDEAEGGG